MYKLLPEKEKRKLRNFTLLIVYAIFGMYFLINGSAHFTQWDESWTLNTIIYLVGVSIFLTASEKLPRSAEKYIDKEFEKPLWENLLGFSWMFPLATIVFIVVKDLGLFFTDVSVMPNHLILATVVYQLIIVCTSEEIIFRGIIFRFLYQYHWIIAWVGSATLFAVFHFAAYGGNIGQMVLAFLIGLVLAWTADRFNIGVGLGFHFAWNMFVLGVTYL